MAKPLNEFGGWINFVKILNLIILFFGIVGIGFLIYLIANDISVLPVAAFIIIDFIITIIIILKINKLLKVRSNIIPNKVIILFLWILGITSACVLVEWIMSSVFHVPLYINLNSKLAIKLIGKSLLPFLFCAAYFKQSKRVLAYYGANANLSFL